MLPTEVVLVCLGYSLLELSHINLQELGPRCIADTTLLWLPSFKLFEFNPFYFAFMLEIISLVASVEENIQGFQRPEF